MSKTLCVHNQKWNQDSPFRAWVEPVKGEIHKAWCSLCERKIDLFNMGEAALKSHQRGNKHKQNSTFSQATNLKTFFCASSPSKQPVNNRKDDCGITSNVVAGKDSTDAAKTRTATINNFVTKENLTKCEILWTLNVITEHQSYSSSVNKNKLFQAMFPDSQITIKQLFKCI